jgi:hypothetical protein
MKQGSGKRQLEQTEVDHRSEIGVSLCGAKLQGLEKEGTLNYWELSHNLPT